MTRRPQAVSGAACDCVPSLWANEIVRKISSGELHPDDWQEAPPHTPLLFLALVAEVEAGDWRLDDGDPYDPPTTASGILIDSGADLSIRDPSSQLSPLEYCETVQRGRTLHPRAAALIRTRSELN